MIVDSSALVAILKAEPEASSFARALEESSHTSISAGTLIETGIVVGRTRQEDLDELLRAASVEVVAVDARHAAAARDAWYRYGRGSGSAARLNFGDCFAYAAAKLTGEPLLFKGDDFIHTDVPRAV
ncbi:type II toxin-antitoxin system VapC family toxin [Propioniciclava soli]|uniref:Ribonuclease VapC n=1 Tax=Propioniciclava soli TaxID=2775081 RepID=A0ABZ3C8W1_9ACTN